MHTTGTTISTTPVEQQSQGEDGPAEGMERLQNQTTIPSVTHLQAEGTKGLRPAQGSWLKPPVCILAHSQVYQEASQQESFPTITDKQIVPLH
jgi:hypothetical protein